MEDGPAIRAAVHHLAQEGHKDIAYIGANRELSSGRTRLEAFLDGAKQAGLEIPQSMIQTGPPSFAMGRARAKGIIDAGQATAILCGGFEISNGALSAVIEKTTASERTISFIGYGDPSFYAWIDSGVSTIQVPVTELAHCAVEMITSSDRQQSKRASFSARLVIR